MKKALFLGSKSTIGRVYPESVMKKLACELEFPAGDVIHLDDEDGAPSFAEQLSAYKDILKDISYIFSSWGMPELSEDDIKTFLPSLKAVFYAAGSVRAFAEPFLKNGVAVFSAWGANGVPVAEMTFAQIILANKGYFQTFHRCSNEGNWCNRTAGAPYSGNYETKVGIIGAGMIGKLVIEKLKTLDNIDVLVFDPFLPDEKAAELGVTKTDLKTIFSECTVISNHLASNDQTIGILNKSCFDLMLPNATFINTGRGAQVVENDLIAALKAEPNRVALLDVTYPEPPKEDSELLRMPNVFLTPHIAGSMSNEFHRMAEFMYEEYKFFDAGKPTRYGVTEKMLATMA